MRDFGAGFEGKKPHSHTTQYESESIEESYFEMKNLLFIVNVNCIYTSGHMITH